MFVDPITFAEFARYVVHEFFSGKTLNVHWTPQHKICHPCEINYDFIGRFENLNNDAKHVLAKIAESGRLRWKVSFPFENAFNREVPLKQQRKDFYDKVPRDIVTKLIRMHQFDYKLFRYDYSWIYRNETDTTQ